MRNNANNRKTKVKREPKRGQYDKETLYEILDAAYVCNLGFTHGGQVYIIPMAFGRDGDKLYLHGATSSRLMKTIVGQSNTCLTVTLLDGLVIARSLFDHSMNYRSVAMFGTVEQLTSEEERMDGLKAITNQMIPGRWDEARKPSSKEMKATSIIAFEIEEFSCKIRSGPPMDNTADLELPIWAGTIAFNVNVGKPVHDPILREGIEIPESVKNLMKKLEA